MSQCELWPGSQYDSRAKWVIKILAYQDLGLSELGSLNPRVEVGQSVVSRTNFFFLNFNFLCYNFNCFKFVSKRLMFGEIRFQCILFFPSITLYFFFAIFTIFFLKDNGSKHELTYLTHQLRVC